MFDELVKDRFDLPNTKGDVGIEIELEGKRVDTGCSFINKYWNVVGDGSLNYNGMEFVLKRPISIKSAHIPLKYLQKSFDESGAKIVDSIRCGCHVHVNVQQLTVSQMFTFVCLYLAFEDVLVDLCGEGRQGNLFCLRMKDAEGLLEYITESISRNNLNILSTTNIRYASLNLSSLSKYGSLEFRAMKGDTNFKRIEAWAKTLVNLREIAVSIGSPKELLSILNTPRNSYNILSGALAEYFSIPHYNSVEGKLKDGLIYSKLVSTKYALKVEEEEVKIYKPSKLEKEMDAAEVMRMAREMNRMPVPPAPGPDIRGVHGAEMIEDEFWENQH